MPTRLHSLRIDEVSLVDRGADPDAKIVFYKRAPDALDVFLKRKFSAEQRRVLAKSGKALPDGSFPIVSRSDLGNAVSAFGRASDKARAKRHIIKRARALGATGSLPESWGVSKRLEAEDMELPEAVAKALEEAGLEEDAQTALSEVLTEALDEQTEEVETLTEQVTTLTEEIETLKAATKDDGDKDPVTKALEDGEVPEPVAKALADEREQREALQKRLDERETAEGIRDSVVKAAGVVDSLPVEAADIGAVLYRVSKSENPEDADVLEQALTAANEAAARANLTGEIGTATSTDANTPEGRIEKIAKRVQAENPTMTAEAAYAKAMQDPEAKRAFGEMEVRP